MKVVGLGNVKKEYKEGELKYVGYWTLLATSIETGYSCEYLSGGFVTNEKAITEVLNECYTSRKLLERAMEEISKMKEK